jgi:hypothetical protein
MIFINITLFSDDHDFRLQFIALDGTALRLCKEFNSDYSWVMFYATISSATIKDAAEGSTGKSRI